MKNKALFRQVALDRLSSPDELDRLLQVTTPQGWIALAGIGILIAIAVLWSIGGSVPTKLSGEQCILVKNGGVNVVSTAAGGRVSDLAVAAGDNVTRGQIIGRLEQYDLLEKIKSQEARLKEAKAQYEQAQALATQGATLRQATLAQQMETLAHQLDAARQKLKLATDRIESQTSLYQQGLITKQAVIASQMEKSSAELEAETLRSQIKQLKVTELQSKKQSDQEVAQAKNQFEDIKNAITQMYREAKDAMAIVSPYSGRVLEVKTAEGQLLERGAPVVSVASAGDDLNELEAFLYLPAAEGKKIRSGMTVEISPSTAARDEYGFLPAVVSSVADYPSSDQGLMHVFGNDKLVKQLSGAQAPIQIIAALKPSSRNASHYQWSTRNGPPFAIESGTACSAMVTLSQQRPIELAIPIFKKAVGVN